MTELRNRYDYIVVDGVPMGIVADATIMDLIADLTLFIIRAGKMDRRQLPDIERIYREKKISNLASGKKVVLVWFIKQAYAKYCRSTLMIMGENASNLPA